MNAWAAQLGAVLAALLTIGSSRAEAQHVLATVLTQKADAIIDLRTDAGVRLVRGAWRYSDATLVPADFRGPGADLKPTGQPVRTLDITPKAGSPGFDDRAWPVIAPTTLEERRTNGRVSFGWYRIAITIPERIGSFDPTGTTAIFEIVVDDYAEVWVDGQLPRTFGQAGGEFRAATTRRIGSCSRGTRGRDRPSRSRCSGSTAPSRIRRQTTSGYDRQRSIS